MDLFDKHAGEQAKVNGMAQAADAQPDRLPLARKVALALARRNGTVDADEVGKVLQERYGIKTLGPAAGSIFSGEHWEFTGGRIVSERKTNHGRELKVWRLKKAPVFCDHNRSKWIDSKANGRIRTACACGKFMGYRFSSSSSASDADQE